MRQRRWKKTEAFEDIELNLAPLLAVMVKLVPVLLISSAFVQMMVIETELPQVVREAMERAEGKVETTLSVEASNAGGFTVRVNSQEGSREISVPLKDGQFNFSALHGHLVAVKQSHPDLFRMELVPKDDVAYGDLIRIMDEARRARDPGTTFPVQGATETTRSPYMFPDVVFSNALGGGA